MPAKCPPRTLRSPRPPSANRSSTWIDQGLAQSDCGRERDPGRVTIRRLNRNEYNNTIRDLIGVDFHPADDFPSDDVGYGFDNIGDVLSMPPILLEKYLTAAEKIAERALGTEQANLVTGEIDGRTADRRRRRGSWPTSREVRTKVRMFGEGRLSCFACGPTASRPATNRPRWPSISTTRPDPQRSTSRPWPTSPQVYEAWITTKGGQHTYLGRCS